MTSDVPDPERLMRANRGIYSNDAENRAKLEATWAPSERENNLRSLADHNASAKHPDGKEHQMRTERSVTVSRDRLRDAIGGISGLIEDTITALIILESSTGITRTDNRQEAVPQCLLNEAIDEKLRFIEFEARPHRKIKDVTSLPRRMTNTTEAILHN